MLGGRGGATGPSVTPGERWWRRREGRSGREEAGHNPAAGGAAAPLRASTFSEISLFTTMLYSTDKVKVPVACPDIPIPTFIPKYYCDTSAQKLKIMMQIPGYSQRRITT